MNKISHYVAKQPDSTGYINYTPHEHQTWEILLERQLPVVRSYACDEYLKALKNLELPSDCIPQCADISRALGRESGWKVAPVPALIDFKQFFTMLAEKTFPAASFIRDREELDYLQEPDIFHEIFGHVPLLSNRSFAEFTQSIGRIGQHTDESNYVWLARLYWFTVEFGLLSCDHNYKALGAGLISSFSELPYSVDSDKPERKPFEILDVLRTPYRIDIHQPIYFVLESVEQLLEIDEVEIIDGIEKAKKLGLYKPVYPLAS